MGPRVAALLVALLCAAGIASSGAQPAELSPLEARVQAARALQTGQPAEALKLARAIELELGDAVDPGLRSRLLHIQGWAQWKLGELPAAMALAEQAEQAALLAADLPNQAEAVQLIGLIQLDDEAFDAALATLQRGLAIAQSIAAPRPIGQAYNNIGIAYRRMGQPDQAVAAYQQALQHRRQAGGLGEVAQTLNNLGVALNNLGDYSAALAAHSESLEIKRSIGEEEEISDSLYNIAAIYENLGDLETALTYFQESFDYDQRAGQKRNMALGLNKISTLELKLGRLAEARPHAEQAIGLLQEISGGRRAAQAQVTLGRIALAEGGLEEAEALLRQAKATAGDSGDLENQLGAAIYLGEVLLAQGKFDLALAEASLAVERAASAGLKVLAKDAFELLSRVQEARGDLSAALAAQRRHSALRLELLNQDQLRQLSQTRRSVEVQQREREIDRLRQETEQQALQVDRARWARNFWIAASIGVFLLLFALASRYWHLRQLRDQQRVNQSLKRLDALKDEFLANTSHELRTPLMGILGLAEALLDDQGRELNQRAQRDLRMIVASGTRLSTLIDDILDLSRIKRDQLALEIRPLDLRVLVELVLALSRPLSAGRDVQLINDLPESLPAVAADENRLQQILHNLVGNALKFTKQGEVRVSAEVADQRLFLRVSDTGIGIDPERQQAIFEPFEQADGSITRTYGGTGVGLTVTRKLVELHGGTVQLESTPGQGSTFSFDLPISQAPLPDDAAADSSTAAGARHLLALAEFESTPAAPLQRRREDAFRVLVVDDESLNRQVLVNYLADRYHVREAVDGQQALELLREEPADLILLDIMMPGLSGYEVCRELRERLPVNELPVIMLTASNRLRDLLQGFALGASDYLTKPISKAELLSRVETHLRLLDISRNLERKVAERTAELERTAGLLRRASETDFLTGLPNRRGLLAALDGRQWNDMLRAVVLIDIDNFKKINDRLGHDGGDHVLRQVAAALRQAQRPLDLLARWGGEEFIVVLPVDGTDEAQTVAERLRSAIGGQDYQWRGEALQVSATLGVAVAAATVDFDGDVKRADQALYQGKAAGKNQVRLAGPAA